MRLGPAEEGEEEEVGKLKQSSSQLPHTVIVRTSDCSRPTATGSCQRSLGRRRKVDWTVTKWGGAPLTLSALAHVQCRPEGCAAAEHSATMRAAPATGSAPQWLGSGV